MGNSRTTSCMLKKWKNSEMQAYKYDWEKCILKGKHYVRLKLNVTTQDRYDS